MEATSWKNALAAIFASGFAVFRGPPGCGEPHHCRLRPGLLQSTLAEAQANGADTLAGCKFCSGATGGYGAVPFFVERKEWMAPLQGFCTSKTLQDWQSQTLKPKLCQETRA